MLLLENACYNCYCLLEIRCFLTVFIPISTYYVNLVYTLDECGSLLTVPLPFFLNTAIY